LTLLFLRLKKPLDTSTQASFVYPDPVRNEIFESATRAVRLGLELTQGLSVGAMISTLELEPLSERIVSECLIVRVSRYTPGLTMIVSPARDLLMAFCIVRVDPLLGLTVMVRAFPPEEPEPPELPELVPVPPSVSAKSMSEDWAKADCVAGPIKIAANAQFLRIFGKVRFDFVIINSFWLVPVTLSRFSSEVVQRLLGFRTFVFCRLFEIVSGLISIGTDTQSIAMDHA